VISAWDGAVSYDAQDIVEGGVMDVVAVTEAVAGIVAAGGVKELAEGAGGGLVAGIVKRIRGVFGSDARSVDALEQARQQATPAAVRDLASALAWYAQRDPEFAKELADWAAQGKPGTVNQQVFAGRDVYVSANDQKIEVRNYPKPGE
jgi:hypothetical protein